MEIFLDDETGYAEWIAAHATGWVLNVPRGKARDALVLHRATCGTISPAAGQHYTGPSYYKVCGPDRERLAHWAGWQPGELSLCAVCRP